MEALAVLASTFYHNPVPGFIFTAILCGSMFAAMAVIAWRNFGPNAKRPDDGQGTEEPGAPPQG